MSKNFDRKKTADHRILSFTPLNSINNIQPTSENSDNFRNKDNSNNDNSKPFYNDVRNSHSFNNKTNIPTNDSGNKNHSKYENQSENQYINPNHSQKYKNTNLDNSNYSQNSQGNDNLPPKIDLNKILNKYSTDMSSKNSYINQINNNNNSGNNDFNNKSNLYNLLLDKYEKNLFHNESFIGKNPNNPYSNGYNYDNYSRSQEDSLKSIIDEKNRELYEIKSKLNSYGSENQTNLLLLKKITEENFHLTSLVNELKDSQITKGVDELKFKELENQINLLRKEVEGKNKTIEKLNKTSISEKNDTKSLKEFIALERNFSKIKEERDNLKSYNSELQTLYGDLIDQINTKKLLVENKNDYKINCIPEKNDIKSLREFMELERNFSKMKEDRDNLKSYTSELQTLYGNHIDQINTKKLQEDNKNENKNNNIPFNDDVKNSREFKELDRNFSKLKEERDNLKSYTSELQTLYGEILDQLNTKKLQGTNEYESNQQKALENLQESYTNISNQKDILETQLKELEYNYANLKSKKKSIKIEKVSLVETINRLNKDIESLKFDIEKLKSNIDLPELFKLELEEKEKAIQILNCSIDERDRIIEQIKNEQNKVISRNKNSHHDLINVIEDLKFKIINLEKELNEKKNFINISISDNHLKKIENENLFLENRQLKEQINLIPNLKSEIEKLKTQTKNFISSSEIHKEEILLKNSQIIKLEKEICNLKNDLCEKEYALQLANDECNTTKLYEKKRDIIQSTLLDIRDLKEKINKDKSNLTMALGNNNYLLSDISQQDINNNETLQAFTSNNNIISQNTMIKLDNENKKDFVIEEATPRTEGLDSYRKITEDDITFFQQVIRNFDLNLLTEFDFLLNSKTWSLINFWLNVNKKNRNFRLNLLYKASRDGFSHLDFKEKCYGKQNTFVIAVTNYDMVIGGYTPLAWEHTDEHMYVRDESEKSFLFNINRKEKLKIINIDHAICLSPDSGPIFGGGSDLEIVDNCNVEYNKFFRIGHSYDYEDTPENFFGSKKYLIKDYEVYELIE